MIPESHRDYVRDHELALWFAVAIVLSSVIALIWPETVVLTPASLLLPDWLETIFRWMFLVGGAAAIFGLLRGRADFEAAGWAVVTGPIITQIITLLFLGVTPTIATSLLTLSAFALGTGRRAYGLARYGHPLTFRLTKESLDG